MTVLSAILGTFTFLLITAAFTFITWWLFRYALREKTEEEKSNMENVT